MIPIWKKNLNSKEINKLIKNALLKKKISEGSLTSILEKEISKILKVKYVSMVSSGTSALLIAMIAIGLKKNDTILIPERSWISLLNAASILGLKVQCIDVKKDKPVIDEKLFEKLNTKAKAIVVVHMGGRSPQMKEIIKIAKRKNIKVIEDAAQAFGSKYQHKNLGTISEIGCFSLSMAKTITSGQGGFLVTNKAEIDKKIRKIKNNGLQNVLEVEKWGELGLNFKYTDFISCITSSELKNHKSYIKNMISLYKFYKKNIIENKFLYILKVDLDKGEIPQYVEIICKDRKKFMKYMKQKKIQCREFYPSMSFSKFTKPANTLYLNDSLFSRHGVFLPSGPHQKISDVKKVIKYINKFIRNNFFD
jgi:perosamine synthetase